MRMRGWGSIGKQQTRIVFLALFSHIYIHTHPNKHETKQNWLTDNRQQMYTAHRRSRQLGNIIHKYIHQFMPRDGRIYIIQMEMGFIYNGCLFTGEAGKTNKTPLLVHRGGGPGKNTRNSDRLRGDIFPWMHLHLSLSTYIRLLSAAGHLSGRDQARVKTLLGIHVYIKSDRRLERERHILRNYHRPFPVWASAGIPTWISSSFLGEMDRGETLQGPRQ